MRVFFVIYSWPERDAGWKAPNLSLLVRFSNGQEGKHFAFDMLCNEISASERDEGSGGATEKTGWQWRGCGGRGMAGKRTEKQEGWVTFAEDGMKEGALPGQEESKEKEVGRREGEGGGGSDPGQNRLADHEKDYPL